MSFRASVRSLMQHGWRTLVMLAGSCALLAVLFVKADSISISEHQSYARDLLWLQRTDAEINTEVLANLQGLYLNFDRIGSGMRRLKARIDALESVPAYLPEEDRRRVALEVSELRRLSELKAEAIDRFQREASIMRNSLSYFPFYTDTLIEEGVLSQPMARRIGIFARGVMSFALTEDRALERRLWQRRDWLLAAVGDLEPELAVKVRNLISHAELILERVPRLSAATREVLELPTSAQAGALMRAYNLSYDRALRTAHVYRVLLFVVALGLAANLAHMIARQRRTARALARANASLEERVEALDQAQIELKRYATVFTHASEGMVITDADTRILAVNPAFTKITGYSIDEVRGKTPAVLQSGRQDAAYYREMWCALNEEGHWHGEIWNRRRDGVIYPEWLSIAVVRDAEGRPQNYIGIFLDVSDQKEAEARIRHLAYHDALTGLPNRMLLQDRLRQAVRRGRRDGSCGAVLFLDLDRFKMINDTLGHEVGDALLCVIAERCLGVVRDTDTVARHGGDEFVLVLPELEHPQDAGAVARKLLAAVAAPCRLGEHELSVSCSIGIALYPSDGSDESILLRNADAAMYRAKAEGRNHYQYYAADMNTASLDELLLEHQLRGALDRDELLLYYQPKVDSVSGQLRGSEALLRWRHPVHGVLPPGRFMKTAEDTGLIVPMGEWVLRETCRQLRAWLDAGLKPVPVAVNLSARQFAQQNLVELIGRLLAKYRLPPQLLELELTESMLMRDVDRAIVTLEALSEMGVGLAIDDFGTGYSSLSYLRQFPVDSLKIDRSFVSDIRPDGSGVKIATAVIALAHSLGLQVTAEGVETEEQRRFLAELRCEYLQGYLFGKPEAAEAFTERLKLEPAA